MKKFKNAQEQAIHLKSVGRRMGITFTGNSCEICETKNGIMDGHHPDYKNPFTTQTLCRACHNKHHAKYGSAPNKNAKPKPESEFWKAILERAQKLKISIFKLNQIEKRVFEAEIAEGKRQRIVKPSINLGTKTEEINLFEGYLFQKDNGVNIWVNESSREFYKKHTTQKDTYDQIIKYERDNRNKA